MPENDFYAGVWTNWGKGQVLGLTLTVSNRDGGLLISFLTMFVRLIGNQMWGILRFMLHQWRSTTMPQDGLFHQQQATLRNATSQSQSLLKMGMLAWFWKSNTGRPIRRSIPMIGLIIFHLGAFTIAGLFTSRLVSSSNETLVPHGVCGSWPVESMNSYDIQNAYDETRKGTLQRSFGYATNCYPAPVGNRFCTGYTKQAIPAKVDFNLSCPFPDPDTCIDPSHNIQIDTGLINSDEDLGINARPENRIQYRKVTTCAPVNSIKWLSGVNSSSWDTNFVRGPNDALPGDKSMYFYFGPQLNGTKVVEASTFSVSNYSILESNDVYSFGVKESVLNRKGAYPDSFLPNSTFFNQTDQDITLLFLINNAQYTDKVEDAWFSAVDNGYSATLGQIYTTDYYGAAVMACMEQHAFCNPNLNGSDSECTTLTGRRALTDRFSESTDTFLQMSVSQLATVLRIIMAIDEIRMAQVVFELGASSLLAQSYLNWGLDDFGSAPVPVNQWQLEVWNWHNTTMANLQKWIIDYVTGPRNKAYDKYIEPPPPIIYNLMCSSQRQRSNDAMSFSGLGVIVILAAGCLIIIVNTFLPTVIGFIQRRLNVGTHQRAEWTLDEVLQLQRMAYQRCGEGTWRNTESTVPMSAHDEKLRHLRRYEGILNSPTSGESVTTEYHYVALKS